jgi:amino acid permease
MSNKRTKNLYLLKLLIYFHLKLLHFIFISVTFCVSCHFNTFFRLLFHSVKSFLIFLYYFTRYYHHIFLLFFIFLSGRPFSNKTSISEKIEKIDKERKDEREREKERDKEFSNDRDEEYSGRGRGGRGRGRGSRGGGRGRGSVRRLQSESNITLIICII